MSRGKIIKIQENQLTISVECSEACASCHQQTDCALQSFHHKIIIEEVPNGNIYRVGQIVECTLSQTGMWLSVVMAYILPLFVMLSVIGIGVFLGYSETQCALMSLLSVAGYYVLLSLCHKRLKKSLKININENLVD